MGILHQQNLGSLILKGQTYEGICYNHPSALPVSDHWAIGYRQGRRLQCLIIHRPLRRCMAVYRSNTSRDDDIIQCNTVCKHTRSTSMLQSAISKHFRRRVSCLRLTISPVHTRCTGKRQLLSLYSQLELPDYTVRIYILL